MSKLFTRLMTRTKDDAGCAVWQGAKVNGCPCIKVNGKTELIRRLIYLEENEKVPSKHVITTTCKTPGCILPEHIQAISQSKLSKYLAKTGLMGGARRDAKIAATKRAKYAKLTIDIARHVRESEETSRALAKQYGVSERTIGRIRMGMTWKDYNNPFAGLFG